MDFERDSAKEQANRKKPGVDFRTAAKAFLDPYVIEFGDVDAAGELRFKATGLVEGRMLFVTYTMRSDVVRIISARGAEHITRFKLDPKKPPKTDWRSFDTMSAEERHRAAFQTQTPRRRARLSFSALGVRLACASCARN